MQKKERISKQDDDRCRKTVALFGISLRAQILQMVLKLLAFPDILPVEVLLLNKKKLSSQIHLLLLRSIITTLTRSKISMIQAFTS